MGLDKKLQKLLRMGLADKKRLQRYESIMSNLKSSIDIAEYRPMILKVLNKLIDNTIDDPMIFQKTQQNLLNIKEEKKMKKSSKIPEPRTTNQLNPDPQSCDSTDSNKYNEETNMEVVSLIKSLVKEKILTEVFGVNLKNQLGTPIKKGVKQPPKAKSASATFNRKMQSNAMKSDVEDLKQSAKSQENLSKSQRDKEKIKQSQSDAVQKYQNATR